MGIISTAKTAIAISLAAANLPAAPADAIQKDSAPTAGRSAKSTTTSPTSSMSAVTTIISQNGNAGAIVIQSIEGAFTKVNNEVLPADFQAGGPHTNAVLFSKDLKQYAAMVSQKLVVGKVPESGVVKINGVDYDTKAGIQSNPKDRVTTVNIPTSSLGIKTPFLAPDTAKSTRVPHMVQGTERKEMSMKFFSGVSRIEIAGAGLSLQRVDGDKVEARGTGLADAKVENGVLKIPNFTGDLHIPPNVTYVKIDSKGYVNGTISTPGEIRIDLGEAVLNVPKNSGLALDATPGTGQRVLAPGFKSKGDGKHFDPATGSATGTLKIQTGFGKIQVRAVESAD